MKVYDNVTGVTAGGRNVSPSLSDYSHTVECWGESTMYTFSLSNSLHIIIMYCAGLQSVCTSDSGFAYTKALCIFNINLSESSVS